jgi:ABC-2 type transport system permease protein
VTTLQEKSAGNAQTGTAAGRGTGSPLRLHVVGAVFKRNFSGYFSNPAGYVFITLFVVVSALAAFFQPEFFTNNLANLATLNGKMPYLLLFFIPAITMSMWAEERRQGTDELLFTLPARDLEVVLGKYLSALAIYSVALIFALSFIPILYLAGNPDLGMMFTTYVGYWLMGAMLISVGMVASLLSSNVTVAFILGAVFSAIPVFIWYLGLFVGRTLRHSIERLSVPFQFEDFGVGVIPRTGVFYFLALTVGMLYVNILLLGRRHWAGGQRSANHWLHATVRVVSLFVALGSLIYLVGQIPGGRLDLTQEQINSLSQESVNVISQIAKDKPVYIQAYISPDVPREYLQTKSDLVGLLKQFASIGGERVKLSIIETELYSDEAREAQKQFGIEPRRVDTMEQSRRSSSEVFLGVAFTSGLEEVVIPFFDRGLPVEYELTRSVRVVSHGSRKKVGILATDAKLMGGIDMRTFGQNPEWSIVTELKKQYEVSSVAADAEIGTDIDVLLVAQPSSLGQRQIENLTSYVKRGGPALVFLDPLPIDNPQISPEVPKQPPGGPFGGGPPPEPKGDLRPFLDLIGLDWPTTLIVWNPYNPIPQLQLPPEVVFIAPSSGATDAFDPKDPASSGLQQLVTLFPGLLRPKGGGGIDFTALLRTSDEGGTVAWSDVVEQGFMGPQRINPNPRHFATGKSYTLAARIQGTPSVDDKPKPGDEKEKDKAKEKDQAKPKQAEINVIAIADLDIISEQFFDLRRRKIENFEFDNVTFVLNCVDVLAKDDSVVALRKRRLKHRTLERLEAKTRVFIDKALEDSKAAELAADDKLKEAQQRFDKQVADLRERKDVDERTKEIMLDNLQSVTNRKLAVEKRLIEDEKKRKIEDSKAVMEREIRNKQNQILAVAFWIPPIPAVLLGISVFGVRSARENRGANPNRLA